MALFLCESVVKSGGIDTSDATASAADILKDKTAYVNGNKLTGSCTYNSDTTADTVTADTLAEGKTAHNSKGEIITGTMTSGGGGGTVTGSDILRFVDIDGNVISTSSPSTITALPSQPSVDGLDSMGWSLTLDECKAKTGTVTVSPVYKPSDNKTHIFLRVGEAAKGVARTINLMSLNGADITIDWGDGTTESVSPNYSANTYDSESWCGLSASHTYST